MSTPPSQDDDTPEQDADAQADAMKAQLRKDVASWSAARNDSSTRQVEEFRVPVTKPTPAPRVKKAKPAPVAAKPEAGPKKPFSMSYNGVTTAEHIDYRLKRGAR